MDFLANLPNGHSLKPEKPTAAHSLGGSSATLPSSRASLNYHYAKNSLHGMTPLTVLPPLGQPKPEAKEVPWTTSNQRYGGVGAPKNSLPQLSALPAISSQPLLP